MSGLQQINTVLERTARRRRLERALSGLWRGLLIGAAIWLVALILYKLLPVPVAVISWGAIALVVSVVTGALAGGFRKPTRHEMARWVDERQSLKERLSTSLELSEKGGSSRWNQLLLDDAVKQLDGIEPRRLLPFHLNRAAKWSVVVLVLAACLGFVPEYRTQEQLQAVKDEAVIRETAKVIAEFTRRTLENKPPALEPTEKALRAANEAGLKLANNPVTKSEALKELANVADQLNQQMKEMAKTPALKKIEQEMRRRDQTANPAAARAEMEKRMEDYQKNLGEAGDQQEKLEEMAQKLQDLKEAAQSAGQNGGMSAEMKQQMAGQMAELSRLASQQGLQLPDLQSALQALQANQTDFFLRDLDLAMDDLEKLRQMSQAMADLQEQLKQMGEDLAEQLEFGQAQAAKNTLEEMQRTLKDSALTDEQKQRLMDELSKSIKPAGGYGEVGNSLAQALADMKAGDKQAAARSLAEAAEELQRLMDQAGDAQSLMASLEALEKAQQCIANGLSFGQCQSTRIGFNPNGSKPGRGVGTWAEENGWLYSQPVMHESWDNSGIERPDMDSRGITDRGDGALANNLAPTKVRGQMSPGAPMPGITLRGVSIKGVSQVDYTEAVTTAQEEAQSALNQDKVPRAYQNSVRNYFDDLN